MNFRNCILLFFCLFFAQTVFACNCPDNFTASNKQNALSDSDNSTFTTDSIFLNKTLQQIQTTQRCFIATIQSIKEQAASQAPVETLTVQCVKTLKGKSLPTHFSVINKVEPGSCTGSAKQLQGTSFICFLPANSLPKNLADCGIKATYCGQLEGIFVTKKRLVSFMTKCGTNGTLCWDYAVNADINEFTNAVQMIPAENRIEKNSNASKGNTGYSLDRQNLANQEVK